MPRFEKGSDEAREYMAKIRNARNKKPEEPKAVKKVKRKKSAAATAAEPENIQMAIEEAPAAAGYQRKKREIYENEEERKEAIKKQKRDYAQRNRDKIKAAKGSGISGGALAAAELKDLLGASYDPKIDKVGDFNLDNTISSGTSKVYYNQNTGQAVIAHRGTAGISDWGNNAVYALGGKMAYKLTPRYKEAKKVQDKAEEKYGKQNVSTIGHSQGGLQAELLGGKSKEIITLNKATRPFESNTNKNQYDIRSIGDLVSGANPFGKKTNNDISITSKTSNPLTEHSSDVLDRLDKDQMIGQGLNSIQDRIDAKKSERDMLMSLYHKASEELDELYEEAMTGDSNSVCECNSNSDMKGGKIYIEPDEQTIIQRQIQELKQELTLLQPTTRGRSTAIVDRGAITDLQNRIARLQDRLKIIMRGQGLKSFKSGSFGSNYVVQSVLFKKDKYSLPEAKKWLKDNKYKSPKVDETDNMLRFRQLSPSVVDAKGYTEYHNKPLGLSGIELIIAYRRQKEERMGQSFKKQKNLTAV